MGCDFTWGGSSQACTKMLSVKLVVLSVKSNTTEGVVLRVVITGRNFAYAVKANINLQI